MVTHVAKPRRVALHKFAHVPLLRMLRLPAFAYTSAAAQGWLRDAFGKASLLFRHPPTLCWWYPLSRGVGALTFVWAPPSSLPPAGRPHAPRIARTFGGCGKKLCRCAGSNLCARWQHALRGFIFRQKVRSEMNCLDFDSKNEILRIPVDLALCTG